MRLIEHNGKKAKITEDDRKKLMIRFNPEELTEDGRGYKCMLCMKHMREDCRACPLKVFASREDETGCGYLVRVITGEKRWLSWARIYPEDVGGIDNIRKVYEAIEALPKEV